MARGKRQARDGHGIADTQMVEALDRFQQDRRARCRQAGVQGKTSQGSAERPSKPACVHSRCSAGIESAEILMTLQPGTRLGIYEIVAPLGAGGMGEVYRALDTRLHREVAIKGLPDAFAKDTQRLARFEREAQLLASLNHPAIATIHGLEQSGERRFIVMELVSGETLAERIGTSALDVPSAIRFAKQIAEGLEAAHARGVIHCDLKPANIAVTEDGRVKLLDFGLARAFAAETTTPEISHSPTITAEPATGGAIFGTVSYMSPEQARGRDIDKRTDIWAFGCVLYEMLAGRKAFTGKSIPDTLASIFEAEPDWGLLPAGTPATVRDLLRHCIQKDPNHRLRDIGDARIELDDTLSGQTSPLPETRARRTTSNRRKAVIAAAGIVAAALALAVYIARRQPPVSAAAARGRQIAVLPFRNLTGTEAGDLMGLAMVDTVRARLSNVPGLQVVTPRAVIEASDNDTNFVRVARKLGANMLLSGSLQRENEQYRITYWLVDASGNRIAANALDGSKLLDLQDRLTAGVVRDLRLPPGAQNTPTPSGLETASEQDRYLQAIGLLQRYDKREGVERALQILQKLAEEKPGSALVQAAIGRASLMMFDFTKDPVWATRAIAATDAARGLDPDLPEVDITFGETLIATGRNKEAVAVFRRALAAHPDRVEALLGLGKASSGSGDRIGAEAALKQAVALQPSFATENQLGAFYAVAGQWANAADQLRKTVRLWPDSPRALSNLGGVLLNACDAPGAMEILRKALAVAPTDPIVISNLALTQLWTGHFPEAVVSLERAVKQSPEDYQLWSNLGDAYRGAGKTDKAREAYDRSIALAREQLRVNPQDSSALSAVATGLAKTGNAPQASLEMQKALEIGDADPNLFSDAAIVAALDNRNADALAWLRKAIAAGYCRSTIARQPEFARLRDDPAFRSIIAAPQSAAGS